MFFQRDWFEEVQGKHDGVHNFTFGTLESYFYLNRAKAVEFDGKVLFVVSPYGGRAKTWVFDDRGIDFEKLAAYQKRGPVYSKVPIALTGEHRFFELSYNLSLVLARAPYPSKKKFYQRVTYPGVWFSKNNIEVIQGVTGGLLPLIEELHTSWVSWKLANKFTYQMMFPRRRYYECVLLSRRFPQRYQSFIAMRDGKPLAVRVLYREKDLAFDLAQFGCFWDQPSVSEYFASVTMQTLFKENVTNLNCGASLNKHLSAFKTHWPHNDVTSYAYPQVKTP